MSSENPHISFSAERTGRWLITRLPPILARDYIRQRAWPLIQLYGSLAIIAAIIIGALR